mgnify:CR=1 FL=1
MKNMTKLILALALLSGVGVAFADNDSVMAPAGRRGVDVHPLYGGYKATRVASTTEALICSGRCILGGLYMSSGPATSHVQFRDSGTADGTLVLTAKMMHVSFVNSNTDAYGNKIPAPIRTSNGIAAKLNAASSNEEVLILWIDGDE